MGGLTGPAKGHLQAARWFPRRRLITSRTFFPAPLSRARVWRRWGGGPRCASHGVQLSVLPPSVSAAERGHCGRQTQPHVHRLEADARPPDSSRGLGLRDLGADVRGGHTPRLPAPMAMRAWNAPVPAAKGRPLAPDAHSRQGGAWDRAWGADGGAASSAPLRRALLVNVHHDKDARKPCLLWAPNRALRSSASSPASVNRALQIRGTHLWPLSCPMGRFQPPRIKQPLGTSQGF